MNSDVSVTGHGRTSVGSKRAGRACGRNQRVGRPKAWTGRARLGAAACASAALAALASEAATGAVYTLSSSSYKSNSVTSLVSAANYTVGGLMPSRSPGTGDEVEVPSAFTTSPLGFGTSNATFGDLIVNSNASFNIGSSGSSSSNYSLTLSGGSTGAEAAADGGAATDLFLLGTNQTQTVNFGQNVYNQGLPSTATGQQTLILGTSGNFDVVNATATLNVYSAISGTGGLNKTGAGTLTLGATNTYSGVTNIIAGTLSISTSYNLGASLGANIYGGTLLYSGTGTLTTGSAFSVNAATSAINVPSSTGNLTFNSSSVVSGPGTLNKVGLGRLTLSGPDTYSGGTNVSAGTLQVGNAAGSSGTGTETVTVNGGVLAGTGFIGGRVVLTAGGTITAGSGGTVNDSTGVLTTNNTHTWTAGGTYNVKVDASNASSGVPGVASDELVFKGLTASTGITINPMLIAATAGSLASGQYSFVIADDTTGAANSTPSTGANTGVFDGLTIGTQVVLSPAAARGGYSLSTMADTSGTGEDLVLDLTATPEPTSQLLLGAAATPLALGRRRRRDRAAATA